jgi:thymidylate synthase (FAD)
MEGQVIIQDYTTKNPITMIGKQAGVCWGANVSDNEKNYKRGLDCLQSEHGRTWEFPDVYMILDGYSARVIREWYTHIGGSPTRLQASTRYINYENFEYVVPDSIRHSASAESTYRSVMDTISKGLVLLENNGISREDLAMLLPLGMRTKIVCKHNFRNLADMSRQRMCTRAYWEYRRLFADVATALKEYSDEWGYLVDHYFMPKCEKTGFCTEKKSCGRKPKKETT